MRLTKIGETALREIAAVGPEGAWAANWHGATIAALLRHGAIEAVPDMIAGFVRVAAQPIIAVNLTERAARRESDRLTAVRELATDRLAVLAEVPPESTSGSAAILAGRGGVARMGVDGPVRHYHKIKSTSAARRRCRGGW